MNKRLQTVSSFISPFWMRMVANRTFQSEVNQQGEIIVEGESLAFQDKAQALAAGTKVMVTVGQWITCLALDEYLSDVESRKSLLEVEAMDRQERSRALSRQAAAFNAGLNIPVAWSVGIKDVLSGLGENSNGDGYNRSTVHHVLLQQGLSSGRLVREKGDFLCTSATRNNGKQWSSSTIGILPDAQGDSYQPRVSCKACLKLARRFQNLPLEP